MKQPFSRVFNTLFNTFPDDSLKYFGFMINTAFLKFVSVLTWTWFNDAIQSFETFWISQVTATSEFSNNVCICWWRHAKGKTGAWFRQQYWARKVKVIMWLTHSHRPRYLGNRLRKMLCRHFDAVPWIRSIFWVVHDSIFRLYFWQNCSFAVSHFTHLLLFSDEWPE